MFRAPCGSRGGGRVDGGGGWLGGGWMGVGVVGGAPPHMCMHVHAHVVNMIISCKWPPPLWEYLGIPYDVIHMCMHMHMHVHVHMGGVHPLTTPHPHPPTPTPRGGPAESVKIQ